MCIIDCLSTIVFILPLHLDYTKVIILILWWRNFQLEYWRTFQLVSTDDAVKASKILGITLTKSNGRKDDEGKPLAMAGFPYHALDTYLPKLIRAGERVAICDQLEMPKQTTSSKRGIAEMVTPGQETGKQMAQESQETEQHTSLRR